MTRGQRDQPDLLQEALDRLILRTLLFGPRYPSLQRLERRGWVAADWGTSENNRRARYYRLTRAGKRRLTEAIARVMRPSEEEG